MHGIVHFDGREYKCNICSYVTKRKDDLRNHALTHVDVYAFKCNPCSYKGKSKRGL